MRPRLRPSLLYLTIHCFSSSLLVVGFSVSSWRPPSLTSRFAVQPRKTFSYFFEGNNGIDRSLRLKAQQEDELSGWVSGLQNWPLSPSSSSSSSSSNTSATPPLPKSIILKKNSRFSAADSFPLTRMLNMEALLSFATTRSEEDTASSAKLASALASAATNATSDILSASNLTFLDELSDWDRWVGGLKQNIDIGEGIGRSGDMLRQATARIESLVLDASSAVSPSTIQAIIRQASGIFQNSTAAKNLADASAAIAIERGLEVGEAAQRERETKAFTADFVSVADGILRKGYVEGGRVSERRLDILSGLPAVPGSRALFANFESAVEINRLSPVIQKDAEMGALAGAIYDETIERSTALGHAIVAQGSTENVRWLVTDSMANASSFRSSGADKPMLIRTITIRGFDASDEDVDREELLNKICYAAPERVDVGDGVLLHSGLRGIAQAIYSDVKEYIDWTSPDHKIVFNGHSIGGSLSLLIVLEMTMERGTEFVLNKVQKVLTFGSPPVTALVKPPEKIVPGRCSVLNAFGLPTSLVYAYIQPWDPIARLFTRIDPLYPLVGDMGADGVTPLASGPPRTLRPIVRALVEAWEGWPQFRDLIKESMSQNYTNAGLPHLMLADPTRYLADRFFAVNIPVPAIETMLRLSPHELQPALEEIFVLDVFDISYVPQAVRSFVHHFFPAYDNTMVDYVKRLEQRSKGQPASTPQLLEEENVAPNAGVKVRRRQEASSGWSVAKQWFQG